jgi:MOSC domain-containing protein YiiM
VSGVIVQLSISKGGVPKRAIEEAEVGPLGVAGDDHADLRYHGGPDRAVCLYSMELLEALAAEGHPVAPGALGENVTTRGVDLGSLVPGDRLALGEAVVLEIASYADPCRTIAHCFHDRGYDRISHKRYPGSSRLYARVRTGGRLRTGDSVRKVA